MLVQARPLPEESEEAWGRVGAWYRPWWMTLACRSWLILDEADARWSRLER